MLWREGRLGSCEHGNQRASSSSSSVHAKLAARIGRHEAHHELAREGPVLAAHVVDVLHVDPDLFLDLARDAALERLAVVHEARDERVAAGRPLRLAGEEHAIAVAHDDDHRRDAGVDSARSGTAGSACPTRLRCARWARRSGDRSRSCFPPERLHGHAAEREEIVGQPGAAHGHERLALEARRDGGLAGERAVQHGVAAQRAEPERLAEGAIEPGRALTRGKPKALAIGNDQELLILDDEPVAALGRRLRSALGRNEGAAEQSLLNGR